MVGLRVLNGGLRSRSPWSCLCFSSWWADSCTALIWCCNMVKPLTGIPTGPKGPGTCTGLGRHIHKRLWMSRGESFSQASSCQNTYEDSGEKREPILYCYTYCSLAHLLSKLSVLSYFLNANRFQLTQMGNDCKTLTHHGWDVSRPLVQLLDVELALLRRGHQHWTWRVEQRRLVHGEYPAEEWEKMLTARTSRSLELPQRQQVKTNLLSGSASTSSSALQVALESLSECCSRPPCSPFSPLSLTSGSVFTWTSPLFMSTSWGSGLGWTELVKAAALASWDPASLSGLFSSFTLNSPYEGSSAFAMPAGPLSWSELLTSPTVASVFLLSPDFEESAWEGEGALSVSELLSPPGKGWQEVSFTNWKSA